jgi:transposase InsO family protein
MAWRETKGIMDQRIEFVISASRGANVSALCREHGISRTTGYKWLNRYHEAGTIRGVVEQSRRPRNSPSRTDAELENRVIVLREKYGWGAKKLRILLRREGLDLGLATINRIISRNGLIEEKDRHRPATTRFERLRPNELWQMDFKGKWKVREGWIYPLTILDDYSRYSVGIFPLCSQSCEPVKASLEKAFHENGVPEEMLMDHGSPWWSTTNGHGLTRLSIFLIEQGIRLIYSGVGHPQTQGKIEAFHRTLKHALDHKGRPETFDGSAEKLMGFREIYNSVRPHEELDMGVPAARYARSTKKYNPNPPAWEYPVEATVKRVEENGFIKCGDKWFFVCEGLAGKLVQVIDLDTRLLVKFRNIYVREIFPGAGRTNALVLPAPGSLV